ncbi:MAG: hypothetical protein V4695_04345 [Pseudomonadota bacterium]
MRTAINRLNAYVAASQARATGENVETTTTNRSASSPSPFVRKRSEGLAQPMPRRVRPAITGVARPAASTVTELSAQQVMDQPVKMSAQQVREHNREQNGAAWQAWANAGNPADGDRHEAVARLLKFPTIADTYTLYLDDLGLTSLPPKLPDTVRGLSLDNNALTELSELPPDLKSLSLKNNRFVKLPEDLPDSIARVSIGGNHGLVALPVRLPSSLDDSTRHELASVIQHNREISYQIRQDPRIERLLLDAPEVVSMVVQNNEMAHLILQHPDVADLILEKPEQQRLLERNQQLVSLLT